MSIKHFGGAAKGQIPDRGVVAAASVMGKRVQAHAESIDALAEIIGHGVAAGRIDPVQAAVATHAANVATVEPPAYVTRDANADYTARYRPNTEGLFGNPQADQQPSGPKMG